MGFFSKLKEGLKKTRESVVGQINTMLSTYTTVDEELFEDLEELLVMGDVGMDTANLSCVSESKRSVSPILRRSRMR